jgi:hypothetical protein
VSDVFPGYFTLDHGFAVGFWFWSGEASPPSVSVLAEQRMQGQYTMPNWSFRMNASGQPQFYLWTLDLKNLTYSTAASHTNTEHTVNDSTWHWLALSVDADKKTYRFILDDDTLATATLGTAINWSPDVGSIVCIGGLKTPSSETAFVTGRFAYFVGRNYGMTADELVTLGKCGAGGRVFYGDTEVQRIKRTLDWSGTPMCAARLDPSLATLMGDEVTGRSALDLVQASAASADAALWADGNGRIVLRNRQAFWNTSVRASLSEMTATGVEATVKVTLDDSWVANHIRGQRPYAGTVYVENHDSIRRFGRRVMEVERNITSAEDLYQLVHWLLLQYAEAGPRIESIQLLGESTTSRRALMDLDVGDRVWVDDLPLPHSEFIVQGVDYALAAGGEWRLTLSLTPAGTYVAQLDAPTDSPWALDAEAKVGL